MKFPDFPPCFPGIHQKQINAYFSGLGESAAPPTGSAPLSSAAYFLCFTNRCGSNYLAQAIASDGRLSQAGENINYDTVINHSKRHGFRTFREYFSWLAGQREGKSAQFGCKVSIGQLMFLNNEGILGDFSGIPRFIHIVREDTISQAVSMFIASKTNQWTSEQKTDAPCEIGYEPRALVNIVASICKQNALFQMAFRLLGVKPLTVVYEEFVAAPGEHVRKIGEFLGIDNLDLRKEQIRYQPQADDRNKWLVSRLREDYQLREPC